MEKLYIKQKVFKITDHYAVIDEIIMRFIMLTKILS